jgi:hypothetical protein
MKVKTAARTQPTSGLHIPRFAGGILVGSGSVFFVGLLIYGLGGRRRRQYAGY